MVFNNQPNRLYVLRQKADKKDADALNELGFLYYEGKVVPQDYNKALEYYHQAVSHGSSLALYNLGIMYHHGCGVEKDPLKAVEYYQKAAEYNHRNALINLAVIYRDELRDDQQSAYWFAKLAERDYIPAILDLADIYLFSTQVTDKRHAAYTLALKAYAADRGKAPYLLACCYFDGFGVEQDKIKALDYLFEAVEHSYAPAVYQWGLFAETGELMAQNIELARECFRVADQFGYAAAKEALERVNPPKTE